MPHLMASFMHAGWLPWPFGTHWVAERARSKFVLNVCPEYFDLGGVERFLYLTARKQVGREHGKVFPIKLSKLWERSGSAGEVSKFKVQGQADRD
jgi:hypothetical protein